MFTHIVAGVDGGPSGLHAVRVASAIAARCGATLTLVHIHPRPVAITERERRQAGHEMNQRGWAAIADAQQECRQPVGKVVDASSSPARGLTEQAEAHGADLIVLGSSQRAGMHRVLAGDTARAVLHAAPCAVALVPGEASVPAPGSRVAAGWNDTPESEAALACALSLAEALDGTLAVVQAVSPPVAFAPRYAYAFNWTEIADAARMRAQERLDERLHDVPIVARDEAIIGSASEVLEEVSRDADILVLGSRGFGPVRRLLVGSTVERLVIHSHCILLVVTRPEHAARTARSEPQVAGA